MDRLLSEQEIIDILGWPTMPDYELHQATAAAQLAKTDKEWVTWFEKLCTGDVYGGMTILHKHWIERKGSIGL
jgi:hypothetical protein